MLKCFLNGHIHFTSKSIMFILNIIYCSLNVARFRWNSCLKPRTMIFYFLLGCVLILLASLLALRNRESPQSPPGPVPWPIFGNAPSLGNQAHLALHAMAKKYGPVFQLKLGQVDAVVLSNHKVAREALCKQKDCFRGRPQFDSYKAVSLGKSVVFNDERLEGWERNKSRIVRNLHLFTTSVRSRERLNELVTQQTLSMTRELERLSERSGVDMEDVIRMSSANTICAFMFGKKYDYDNKEFKELLSMNREFGVVLEYAPIIDSMPWIARIPFLKFKKAMEDYYKINLMLDEWNRKRVVECLSDLDSCGQITNIIHSIASEYFNNNNVKLDGCALDEDQIDEVAALSADMFGAGQHTVSVSMFWILTYLQVFPEIKEKMVCEVERVVPHDRLPCLDDRNNLAYLEAFIFEVFRHATPLSGAIPHCTLEATMLNGYFIPKGRMVILNQYSANHDPEAWTDPERFDPERFLSEFDKSKIDSKKVDQCLVFSIGPRKCPGAELTRMWFLLMLAILLKTCDIIPDKDQPTNLEAIYGLILNPRKLNFKIKIKENCKTFVN